MLALVYPLLVSGSPVYGRLGALVLLAAIGWVLLSSPELAAAPPRGHALAAVGPGVAALLLVAAQFMPGGGAGVGWTLYAPLSTQAGPAMDLTIFAVHILGMSSIMGSINIITTILNMRAPGMTLMRIPLFCWTWLITAYLLVAVMPVLAGAVTMTLTDRHFGTHFFNAAGGGLGANPLFSPLLLFFFLASFAPIASPRAAPPTKKVTGFLTIDLETIFTGFNTSTAASFNSTDASANCSLCANSSKAS